MILNKLVESYNNWCENTNLFECYVKSTTLASLATLDYNSKNFNENYDINDTSKNSFQKLKSKIENSLENTFLISDIEPEENLDFSIMLNNDLDIKPILSFNHIAHDYGLVGNEVIHNKIVNSSSKFKKMEIVKAYCFILDNTRYKNTNDYLNPLIFNNQYEITEEELPHVEVLKMMSIDKLIFIYRNSIKEDLEKYLDYLKEEKIEIILIDLDSE